MDESPYWPRRRDALQFAREQHRHPTGPKNGLWTGRCQQFVSTGLDARITSGAPFQAASAIDGWQSTKLPNRHLGEIPAGRGLPLYWMIGAYGHIALSAGHDKDGHPTCWSTDILQTGHVSLVRVGFIARKWGAVYLGYGETINGVRVMKHAG